MAKYTFLKLLSFKKKTKKLWKNNIVPQNNLTPAELICHLLFCASAYLRKDNSCKNWSKEIIFTVFKRRQIAYCDKHRDLEKVINTWNDDQLNLKQKIQHIFQGIPSTKCNGWKCSTFTDPTELTQNNKSWKFQFN